MQAGREWHALVRQGDDDLGEVPGAVVGHVAAGGGHEGQIAEDPLGVEVLVAVCRAHVLVDPRGDAVGPGPYEGQRAEVQLVLESAAGGLE